MKTTATGRVCREDENSAYEFHIKARAKVNLSLHIEGRRADGYHELEGLVAFADIADELHFKQEGHLEITDSGFGWSLQMNGPFAAQLVEASTSLMPNLVVQAARLFQKEIEGCRGGEILLEKNLPIAAGIGGGSSDAAATLNVLRDLGLFPVDDDQLKQMAVQLGADVAMCLSPQAKVIAGVGDIYEDVADFQPLPAVLVNPGVSVSTALVFKELAAPAISETGDQTSTVFDVATAVVDRDETHEALGRIGDLSPLAMTDWLRTQRNDLQEPAIRVAPAIADVLKAIDADESCRLARMSGSGATCFGLYDGVEEAGGAARKISADYPDWWVVATMLR